MRKATDPDHRLPWYFGAIYDLVDVKAACSLASSACESEVVKTLPPIPLSSWSTFSLSGSIIRMSSGTPDTQRLPTAKIDFAPSVGVSHLVYQSASEAIPHRVKCSTAAEAYKAWGHRLSLLRTFFKNIAGLFAAKDHRRAGTDLPSARYKQHLDPAGEPTRLKDSWPLICAASGVLRCRSQERTTGHPKGKGERVPTGSHPPAPDHIWL
jgi:hypothetical protein